MNTVINLVNGKLIQLSNNIPGIACNVKYGFCWLLLGTSSAYKIIGLVHPLDYEEYSLHSHPDNEHVLEMETGDYLIVQTWVPSTPIAELYCPDRFVDAHHSKGGWI